MLFIYWTVRCENGKTFRPGQSHQHTRWSAEHIQSNKNVTQTSKIFPMPQNQRNLSECDGNRLLRGKVEEKIDLISDSKIRNSEKTIM